MLCQRFRLYVSAVQCFFDSSFCSNKSLPKEWEGVSGDPNGNSIRRLGGDVGFLWGGLWNRSNDDLYSHRILRGDA